MKTLLIFLFYGLFYYLFEAVFNYICYDIPDKKKCWQEKLRLRVSIAPSFWMLPVGSIAGLILNLLFLIPLNYNLIYILLPFCLIGSGIITGLELGAGYLLNIKLMLKIWNYNTSIKLFGKTIPLNYLGQIDIYHSVGWFGITFLFYFINKLLF